MAVIQITKNQGEPGFSVLRRFSKRVNQSGLIRQVKAAQERVRPLSEFKKRKNALRRLSYRAQIERLRKLGQLPISQSDRRR